MKKMIKRVQDDCRKDLNKYPIFFTVLATVGSYYIGQKLFIAAKNYTMKKAANTETE